VSTASNLVLARVDGQDITLKSMQSSLQLRQQLQHAIDAATERTLVLLACERARIEASTAEVQAAFNAVRRKLRLLSAERTKQWLKQEGLSLDDMEAEVRCDVLREKWRERLSTQVEGHFHQHKSQFQYVALARVVVRDKDVALELLAELEEGEVTFEELVQRKSIDAASRVRGGFWGEFHRGQMVPTMAVEAFGAGLGAVLGPYAEASQWVLLKVLDRRDGTLDQPTRAAVLDLLYRQWLDEARQQAHIEVLPES
jgi:parvulin-like peptidyl-prolyl isomerase